MFPKNLKSIFAALMLFISAATAFAFSNDVALQQLPKEAQSTYALIQQGGPFPYEKDGTTFGNRERLLPQEKRGYYREYTVKTPATKNRGAIRIVCGGIKPKTFDSCYYTNDHYASFKRIMP
jgi:ribonuclease T1